MTLTICRCFRCGVYGPTHAPETACPETITLTLEVGQYAVRDWTRYKEIRVEVGRMRPWPALILHEGRAWLYDDVDRDDRRTNNDYEYRYREVMPVLMEDTWIGKHSHES